MDLKRKDDTILVGNTTYLNESILRNVQIQDWYTDSQLLDIQIRPPPHNSLQIRSRKNTTKLQAICESFRGLD